MKKSLLVLFFLMPHFSYAKNVQKKYKKRKPAQSIYQVSVRVQVGSTMTSYIAQKNTKDYSLSFAQAETLHQTQIRKEDFIFIVEQLQSYHPEITADCRRQFIEITLSSLQEKRAPKINLCFNKEQGKKLQKLLRTLDLYFRL